MIQTLGFFALVLSAVGAWPQAWRSVRTRGGVSALTAVAATVNFGWWSVYTALIDDWWAFAASASAGAGWAVAVGAVAFSDTRSRLLVFSGAALFTLGVLSEQTGVLAAVGGALWVVPQVVSVLRRRPSHGVSIATFLILVAENAVWIGYGALTRTWVYIPPAALQLVASVLVAAYTARITATTAAATLAAPGAALALNPEAAGEASY